jgi:hypothetical protein
MIFGAEFARRVVVVDFPEDAPTFVLKRAEVVLTVRVVLGREGLELHDLGRDGDLVAQGQGGNALRHEPASSAAQAAPESVIEFADALRVVRFGPDV